MRSQCSSDSCYRLQTLRYLGVALQRNRQKPIKEHMWLGPRLIAGARRMMRARATVVILAAGLWATASPCWAQGPNGTISGHVVSADGEPLPGVLISATSDKLQGTRTATTSANGDY